VFRLGRPQVITHNVSSLDRRPRHVVQPGRRFFAVVDSRGRARWNQKTGERHEHLVILVSRATPPAYLAFLRDEQIPYLAVGAERVSLAAALPLRPGRLGSPRWWPPAGGC
jgi:2,5-diamino-6-(ribosylamino)-4(3H)-pyrimidinone 5'-phosphate reductase